MLDFTIYVFFDAPNNFIIILYVFPAASTNLNLDYLDSIFSSNASQYTSTTSLNQSMSKSSMQSYGKSRGRRLGRKPSISQSPVSSKLRVQSAESSTDGTIIDYIAESQKSAGGQGSARKGQGSGSKQRPVDARKLYEALTPIRETTMEEDHEMMSEHKPSNVSVTLTKAHSRVPERKQKEVSIKLSCKMFNYVNWI